MKDGADGLKFERRNGVMAFTKTIVLLLIGLTASINAEEFCEVDDVRDNVVNKLDDLWFDTGTPEWKYLAKNKKGLDGTLVEEFKKVCESMDNMTKPKVSDSALTSLWTWAVLEVETFGINNLYSTFRRIQKPDPPLYSQAWLDFTELVLKDSEKASVLSSLNTLQELIYSRHEGQKDLFEHATEEAASQLCEINQSPQQLIYNMYVLVQMTQLKAYTMAQFSWMLLRLYEKGNYTTESESLRNKYVDRVHEQALVLKDTLEKSDRSLWKCDPKTQTKDVTYTEVTKFLQGMVLNEIDLNSEHTCRENCAYYKYTRQYGCYKNNFGCAKQPMCRGTVVGCTFVDSDMWICQSPHTSKRRYDWIEYENGRVLGAKSSCQRAVTKVDSWWRYLFWHCSYCLCYCDDHDSMESDRYFYMRSVTSNVTENKIVTGMRLIKVNRVLALQLQEGLLTPKGNIDPSTISWIPVENINVRNKEHKHGVDFFKFTWEERTIDLDDLKCENNQVLSGVKFRKVGSHLNMEIQCSEFNFTTGKLTQNGERSHWIGNDKTEASPKDPRTKVILHNPDVPTRAQYPSKVDSHSNQCIDLVATDLDLDAGQSTAPFFDTQAVSPEPPVPLSGAGLYHKGSKWYGGFIGPKVITYDFTPTINANTLDVRTKVK